MVAVVFLAGCHKKPRWDGVLDLHRAAWNGDLGQVQRLIVRGALVNAEDTGGGTALHEAALQGHKDVAEVLVCCGARMDSMDNRGRTPVMVAMERDHRAVVEYFVRAGAVVDLHLAAYLGDAAKVKSLIDSGADITARDRDGWTPLCYAASYGCKEVAKLLIAAAADPNGPGYGTKFARDTT
jgi:ankyrin repeat protein